MPVSPDYVAYVLEQLAGLGNVRARRMFGGIGLYAGEVFFAIIDDDVLYLKVFEETRAEFIAGGGRAFAPYRSRPERSLDYYSVPAAVLDDPEELVRWARNAVARAARFETHTKPRRRR